MANKPIGTDGRGVNRRGLLVFGAGLGSAAAAAISRHDGMLGGPSETISGSMPWADGQADDPGPVSAPGHFLTTTERAFVVAAADRLIPADATGPSASQAGVIEFIDRELAGDFGRGQHLYLGGPWPEGLPSQGYQSRFSPAQLYRHAIAAIDRHVGAMMDGRSFARIAPDAQDTMLRELENGTLRFDGNTAQTFFAQFLQNVKEGYLADPLYGGNRNMAAWRMIGFPGARYDYSDWVLRHGERYPYPPVGLRGRSDWSES